MRSNFSNALLGLTALSGLALASTASAQIKISQVFPIAGSTDGFLNGVTNASLANGDFVELFNPTTSPVTMSGWSLHVRGGGILTRASDNATLASPGNTAAWTNYWFGAVLPRVTIGPGQYYLVRLETIAGPGPTSVNSSSVPYAEDLSYPGSYNRQCRILLTAAGSVALMSNTNSLNTGAGATGVCPTTAGGLVDFFQYGAPTFSCADGGTNPIANGTSGAGSVTQPNNNSYQRNGGGCATDTNNFANDFSRATTNPRRLGSIDGFSSTPSIIATATSAQQGLTNGTVLTLNITGWTIAPFGTGSCAPLTTSTNQRAVADLSQLGGSAAAPMTLNAGVYSVTHTVSGITANGQKTIVVSVIDNEGHTVNRAFNVSTYTAPPDAVTNDGATPNGDGDLGTTPANPQLNDPAWTSTKSVSITAARPFAWFKITLSAPATNAPGGSNPITYLDLDTKGSAFDPPGTNGGTNDTYMFLFNSTGTLLAADDDNGGDQSTTFFSQLSFGGGVRPATGGSASYDGRNGNLFADTYYICALPFDSGFNVTQGFIATSPATSAGQMTVNARFGTSGLAGPPLSTTPIPSTGAVFTSTGTPGVIPAWSQNQFTTNAPAQIVWFRFTLNVPAPTVTAASGIAFANRTYIDIDTEQTTPINDTAIGLYDATTGNLIAFDQDDGTALLGMISIGRGGRPAPGDGRPYPGLDTPSGNLPNGQYFVAVCEGPGGFANGWQASSLGNTSSFTAVCRVRVGQTANNPVPPGTVTPLATVQAGPQPVPSLVVPDLGVISGSRPQPVSTGDMSVSPGEIRWVKFTIVNPIISAADLSSRYLDIDTIGSDLPATSPGEFDDDTYLILMSGDGNIQYLNDDSNNTGVTPLQRLSSISVGRATPVRPYSGTSATGGRTQAVQAGGGQGGGTVTPGTATLRVNPATIDAINPAFNGVYWIGVCGQGTGAAALTGTVRSGWDFNLVTGNAQTGTVRVNVYSNLGAIRPCNAADVASLGSGINGGPDGSNTADDIIAYLAEFFNNNVAVADLITLGGGLPATPDGSVTVDDLIYFLNQFFAPCNP
jgi:hypothetical protein